MSTCASPLPGASPDVPGSKTDAVPRGLGARGKVAVGSALFALLAASFFATYGVVTLRPAFYDPSLAADRWIGLRPAWVWIYLLYYPFCFVPLMSREILNDMRAFLKLAGGFLFQFGLALPIFYFFPTRIVHPAVPGSGLSAVVLRGLYGADAGYCVFPSLHVANSCYVALIARRTFPKPAAGLSALLCVLIAASVLFVKQHFLLDVPAGAALGWLAYRVFSW